MKVSSYPISNRFIILLGILVFSFNSSFAQIFDPVTWSFSSRKTGPNEAELILTAKIDKTWHLYSQIEVKDGPVPTSFHYTASKSYQLVGKTSEPNVKGIYDKVFQATIKFFEDKAVFKQKVKILDPKPSKIKGTLEFMACDDTKCLPPKEVDFEFSVEGAIGAIPINNAEEVKTTASSSSCNCRCRGCSDAADEKNSQASSTVSQQDTAGKKLAAITMDAPSSSTSQGAIAAQASPYEKISKNLWSLFFFSFLAGIAAIFTPCVFPMIPMTVTFFMKDKQRAKAIFEALAFGFSIILIYTVIGTLVALIFGANFANFISTHWLPNVLFFLIFLIFAASFLGMFEITLPSWMINKSDQAAEKGGLSGPFFMAFTLVLVSFSCTGPIVGAILVQSAGGAVIKPIISMLGFSLAFALPFTLFAFFPHWLKNLPKSGGWLNAVKVVLGFLELALGLKFLSIADQTYHWHILDREVYLALWIVIFALMGIYLLGKIKFAHDSDVKEISFPRICMAIITFAFVVYMIPGMFGAPLKVLSGYIPPQSSLDFDLNAIIRDNAGMSSNMGSSAVKTICEKPRYGDFLHLPHGLQGYFDYQQGLECAKKQNKPVFIDFTGHGCVNCRQMEANVWSAPTVLNRLRNDFVVIALYVDDKTSLPEAEWVTSKYDGKVKNTIGKKYADLQITRFNVNAQPYYVLLDNNGDLLVPPRAYNLDIEEFQKFLDNGTQEYKKRHKLL